MHHFFTVPIFFHSHRSKSASSSLTCECELNVKCVQISCQIRTKFTLGSVNSYMGELTACDRLRPPATLEKIFLHI